MCRVFVQRQVKSFMLQPEYPLTWTYFGAVYKGNSKASCSSQNIPLHEHVSGLCTKVSRKLRALARISPYMDMFPGFVQRQVESFMFQPEYPLTWTCFGALYNGKSKASCSSQNIPLHGHVGSLYKGKSKASCSSQNIPLHGHISGLCTKATQKLHALARISPYMNMFRGFVQRKVKSFMFQPEYPLTWTCFGALYKGKSKASCSSQNIPLHGHESRLCTKASQKLHALARISPDMDMCRGSVQRQVKSFMLQPEYPLTLICVGALYKGKSNASCSSQNIPLH